MSLARKAFLGAVGAGTVSYGLYFAVQQQEISRCEGPILALLCCVNYNSVVLSSAVSDHHGTHIVSSLASHVHCLVNQARVRGGQLEPACGRRAQGHPKLSQADTRAGSSHETGWDAHMHGTPLCDILFLTM
eukprot:1141259-Pelagomonas_calceolata.AAC.5